MPSVPEETLSYIQTSPKTPAAICLVAKVTVTNRQDQTEQAPKPRRVATVARVAVAPPQNRAEKGPKPPMCSNCSKSSSSN
jgi:hypothetical protein